MLHVTLDLQRGLKEVELRSVQMNLDRLTVHRMLAARIVLALKKLTQLDEFGIDSCGTVGFPLLIHALCFDFVRNF